MALINYGIKLILIWSSTCVITNSTLQGELAITNTKLYDSIVTLSTQDNTNLPQKLRSSFKKIINWNKY